MHCHGSGAELPEARGKIALVGNPNVGKSVVFGCLTGRYATVSNYPGTTVEIARGAAKFNRELQVIDTPGINDLIPMSEDERVTRDILLREGIDAVVQVADAKNLARALMITLQLGEMGIPMVLALNMIDEAAERGIKVNARRLEQVLGVPVVSMIATQRKGIRELVDSIPRARPASGSATPAPLRRRCARLRGCFPAGIAGLLP